MIEKLKRKPIGIAVLLIILLVLIATGVSRGNFTFWGSNQEANIAESDLVQDLLNDIDEQEGENASSESSSISNNGLAYFDTVRVPVLAKPDLFDYEGEKTMACKEEIVWINAEVESTRAPLTASIEKLLNYEKDFGFEPANFLVTQDNLSLDEVVIENSVAKIYLEGEFTIDEECDLSRIFTQLEEVSMQYNSVSVVQIYLNGELLR